MPGPDARFPIDPMPVGGATQAASLFGSAVGLALGPVGAGIYSGLSLFNALRKAARSTYHPALKTGEQVDRTATDIPIPVVYGRCNLEGHWIHREDSSETDKTFDCAIAFGEGEVEEITDVRVNGRLLTEMGQSNYTVYTGTATQEADSRFGVGSTGAVCEADAYTDQSQPDTNFGNAGTIQVRGVSHENRIYLRFNFEGVFPGATITDVQIRLSQLSGNAGEQIECYGLTGDDAETWDESVITWNNAPEKGTRYSKADALSSTIVPNASYGYINFSEAGIAAVRAAYNAGTTLSMVLIPAVGSLGTLSGIQRFGSRESEYQSPVLSLEVLNTTAAPAFRNTAYIAAHIDNTSGYFSERFPKVTAVVKGVKVRVWDGTSWSWQWSENPAWIVFDIMTHPIRGMGALFNESVLDVASFKDVADYCAEQIERSDGLFEARYTCNFVAA